jgi:hypothetical protein
MAKKGGGMNALGHVKSTHKTQIGHRQSPVGAMQLPRGSQPTSGAEAAAPPGGAVDRAGASAMFPAPNPGNRKIKGSY